MKLLFKSSTSAFFEIEGSSPYYSEKPYDVFLNGKKVISERRENTFSLFSLLPDTEYEVRVADKEEVFTTEKESGVVSILDFGAVGDGVSDDSTAIRSAIEACPKEGRVYFPKGVYLTEPIRLKSDMTLELSDGAVLLGVTDTFRYPVLPAYINVDGEERIYSAFEGIATPCYTSFVSAYFEKNIKIVGEGVIDANAENSVWWTPEYVNNMDVRRPRLLFLNGCENVKIHGITGKNGASWNFHPFFSKNLGIYGLKVEADKNSPNTDGLDPECCEDVTVVGCRFSVGDDCMAIKSGKIDIGRKYNATAKNHTVRNCLMEFGHGGVVLGSEIGSGVSELYVSQCIFSGTERGLRIKSRRGRGKNSVVDNVEFDNILMDGVGIPFVINMHYDLCDPDGKSDYVQSRLPMPVDETTPRMGRFLFKNIKCQGSEIAAGYFEGLSEMPIEEVALENVDISFKTDAKEGIIDAFLPRNEVKKQGLTFKSVRSVILKNLTLNGYTGEKIITFNCEKIRSEEQ